MPPIFRVADWREACGGVLGRLYINGKFTAQSMTGVQRAAHEWVLAIDRLIGQGVSAREVQCELLCPPESNPPALRHVQVRRVGRIRRNLAMWEQFCLPAASRQGCLLNLAGSAPWRSAARSVCSLHDAAVFDRPDAYTLAFRTWYRHLFRHLGRRAPGLVTVSEFSRQRLAACLQRSPDRIRVVHNGADHFGRVTADPSLLHAHGIRAGEYLLVVGTDKRTKNIPSVLQAWRQLPRREGRKLVWVGGSNSRVFANDGRTPTSPSTDLGDDIRHLGVVSDDRLKSLYEHAAGLIIASTYEGFGFPAVEAMACGCPVAAARMASLPEVCGDAALYFDADRIESIAEAMTRLLDDDALRRRLAARGRDRAASFSWDAGAKELLAYVDSLDLA